MTFRSSIPAACGLLLSLGLLLVSPQPASAAEVMCSNDFGECTVSNDGQSWISCSCTDESGTGGSGGDEYAGLTEAELLEICNDELAWCDGLGGDGDGDGCGDSGTTGGGSTGGDTGLDTGGESDTGLETGGCDPTEGDTGFETGSESTGDGDTGFETGEESTGDGGGGTAEGDTGDPTTGSGDDGGDGDGDPTGGQTTGDDGGDGDGDPTGGQTTDEGDSGNSEEDTGGESDGGDGETGLAADDIEGAGCSVTSHSGFGLFGLALLGLFGIHRRERKLAA